jgi:hypothetical protein
MERIKFFRKIGDVTLAKLEEKRGQDLITYCLEELQGCEKLYGLMFIFTQLGDLKEEDSFLIGLTSTLVIGDMMNMEDEFINRMTDNIIESFYSFDRLKDGYLVNHNFDEMEKYLEIRKSRPEKNLN